MPHVHGRSPGTVIRRRLVAVLALVAGLGLSTACADGRSGDTTPSPRGGAANQTGGGHEGASPAAPDARHVTVTARPFAFEPKEIIVRAGEDIAIVLHSEDGLHDFTVDELDAHVAAGRGGTSVGGLRAERPGRYAFYCSVQGHREAGMDGILVVEA